MLLSACTDSSAYSFADAKREPATFLNESEKLHVQEILSSIAIHSEQANEYGTNNTRSFCIDSERIGFTGMWQVARLDYNDKSKQFRLNAFGFDLESTDQVEQLTYREIVFNLEDTNADLKALVPQIMARVSAGMYCDDDR